MRRGLLVAGLVLAAFGGVVLWGAYTYAPSIENALIGGYVLKPWAYNVGLLIGWTSVGGGAIMAIAGLVSPPARAQLPAPAARPPGLEPSSRWPPGWYHDPAGEHELRFWNGDEWTEQVRGEGFRAGSHPAPERASRSTPAPDEPAAAEKPPRSWISIAAVLLSVASVATAATIAIVGNDDESTTTSESSAVDAAGRPLAETPEAAMEAASFTAASHVQELGFEYFPPDFAATCADVGSTWSCDVDGGQCSGTVDVYFRGHEYLEAVGTNPEVFCAD